MKEKDLGRKKNKIDDMCVSIREGENGRGREKEREREKDTPRGKKSKQTG